MGTWRQPVIAPCAYLRYAEDEEDGQDAGRARAFVRNATSEQSMGAGTPSSSKLAPSAPKLTPSSPKLTPSVPKLAPKCTLVGFKSAQVDPKCTQAGPKMAPSVPK